MDPSHCQVPGVQPGQGDQGHHHDEHADQHTQQEDPQTPVTQHNTLQYIFSDLLYCAWASIL